MIYGGCKCLFIDTLVDIDCIWIAWEPCLEFIAFLHFLWMQVDNNLYSNHFLSMSSSVWWMAVWCLVNGSMVFGEWKNGRMVFGEWKDGRMVFGEWKDGRMVFGEWKDGVWCLVNGMMAVWFLVNGRMAVWCLVNGRMAVWCLVNGRMAAWCLVNGRMAVWCLVLIVGGTQIVSEKKFYGSLTNIDMVTTGAYICKVGCIALYDWVFNPVRLGV